MQRVEVRITGRVQGVGFRQFAHDRARRLGLKGWVRNERDGSVRAVAEGDEHAIDQWLQAVGSGPPLARVDDVDVRRETASGMFRSFEIAH